MAFWRPDTDFQVSGIYFFGSGQRFSTIYNADLRRQGLNPTNRLRPDGTIVPRNDFVGEPIHRVDVRLQRRFSLGGDVSIDGIAEVFNLFNRVELWKLCHRRSERKLRDAGYEYRHRLSAADGPTRLPPVILSREMTPPARAGSRADRL